MPRFEITHGITRAEYITFVIEADNEQDAQIKGLAAAEQVSTADYSAGDVIDSDDGVDVTPVPDDTELTDLDNL